MSDEELTARLHLPWPKDGNVDEVTLPIWVLALLAEAADRNDDAARMLNESTGQYVRRADYVALYDQLAAAEAKLATCEKYRDAYAECDRVGTQAVRDLEAKLAVAHAAGRDEGIQQAAIVAQQALIDGAYIKRGSHQETPSSVMFLAETLVSNAIGSLIPAIDKIKGEQP